MKIRINDTVAVIAGKDAGKQGKVTKVFPKKSTLVVEGMNTYKRHMKRQSEQQPGGIVEIERALDISKVQLVCPSCKALTRVGMDIAGSVKVRVCKRCGKALSEKSSKKVK